MSELLPCPFCKGKAYTIKPARYGKSWGVLCECGAFLGYEYTEAEAIARWNSRAPIEYDGWFYLPKPKEGIVDYGEPELTRTENGYKVRQIADIVDEAARKWGDDLGEYIMRRICEVWNSRAERIYATGGIIAQAECRNVCNSLSEFTCNRCGFNCDLTSWISLFDGDEGRHRHHHHGTPNYCPNCGAKVVGE